jgi:RHS repeat-associated protein
VIRPLPSAELKSRIRPKIRRNRPGVAYYGYRYYDPVTGRWPSRDRIEEEGGANLYGFVGNNGLNTIDLLGMATIANNPFNPYDAESTTDPDDNPNADYYEEFCLTGQVPCYFRCTGTASATCKGSNDRSEDYCDGKSVSADAEGNGRNRELAEFQVEKEMISALSSECLKLNNNECRCSLDVDSIEYNKPFNCKATPYFK